MNEVIENEVQLQIMSALDAQAEADFRVALACLIDALRSGRSSDTEAQSHALQNECWTGEVKSEIADRIESILNTHYTTELGY